MRSHLCTADLGKLIATGARPGGPPPLPKAQHGAAIEVERVVSKDGQVHLAGRYVIAAEILGGRRVGVRIEENTLRFGVSRGAHLPRRLQAESDATFHPVDIPRQPGSSSLLIVC